MPAKQTGATGYADSLLKLIFNATSYSGFAVNDTGTPFTNLWVSLHTASPGAAGAQNTSETTYTGYTRVAITRTGSGWTVSSNTTAPVNTITFPQANSTYAGGEIINAFAIGVSASGASNLLYYGSVSPTITMGGNVTPELVGGLGNTQVTET